MSTMSLELFLRIALLLFVVRSLQVDQSWRRWGMEAMTSSMLVWWVSSAHRLLGCHLQLAPVVKNPAGTFHHPSSQ